MPGICAMHYVFNVSEEMTIKVKTKMFKWEVLFNQYGFRFYLFRNCFQSGLFSFLILLAFCEIWWYYWCSLMKITLPAAFVTSLPYFSSCFSDHSISLLFFLLSWSVKLCPFFFIFYRPSLDDLSIYRFNAYILETPKSIPSTTFQLQIFICSTVWWISFSG